MSRYKAYSEYKDSGVEWLGQLPSHWGAKRLGQFFDERREKVSDEDYPALSVTMQGIVPQLETAAKTDAGDNRKLVLKDDFVINSRSDRKGSSGVSSYDGSVSLISIVMIPKGIHPPFAHHLLRSYPFQEEFYRYGKGIVADLWSTNVSEMRNILIPHAPITEQEKISAFLDHETAKIDALIEKQKRLIELLKEKRQAVISHAVTKGLNPNAPMKDSGVEWLGEVPAHWVVLKLGLRMKFKGGAGFPDSYQGQEEQEIPFYKVGDLARANSEAGLTEPLHTITRDTAKELRATIFNTGSIVFAKVGAALLLKRFCVLTKPSCIDNNMMGAELSTIELRDFLLFLLPLLDFELIVNPGAVPSVNGEQISSILIALPPRDEQREIVKSLKSSRIKFDHLVTSAEQAITLFQERRTALISAAVTGKIDVRDWQAAD